jgi:hypothetical protein
MMAVMLALVLCSTAALAQDKPAAAAKPAAQAKQAKPKAAPAKPKPPSIAARLQACLEIDDATKERLNCYDAIFPPTPRPKPPAAKAVTDCRHCYDAVIAPQPKPKPAKAKGYADCRFFKEEDERLACFNGFAEKIPTLPG